MASGNKEFLPNVSLFSSFEKEHADNDEYARGGGGGGGDDGSDDEELFTVVVIFEGTRFVSSFFTVVKM
eukprot:12299045-Ditylum_brightwellii.AAC.1